MNDDAYHRPNTLAWASSVVGGITLVAQPVGCCLFPVGTVLVFVGTFAGLGLGLLGYRQAQQHDFQGMEMAVFGLSVAAVNVVFDLVWLIYGLFWGSLTGLMILAQ